MLKYGSLNIYLCSKKTFQAEYDFIGEEIMFVHAGCKGGDVERC